MFTYLTRSVFNVPPDLLPGRSRCLFEMSFWNTKEICFSKLLQLILILLCIITEKKLCYSQLILLMNSRASISIDKEKHSQ